MNVLSWVLSTASKYSKNPISPPYGEDKWRKGRGSDSRWRECFVMFDLFRQGKLKLMSAPAYVTF